MIPEQELNLSILPSLGEASLEDFMSDEFIKKVTPQNIDPKDDWDGKDPIVKAPEVIISDPADEGPVDDEDENEGEPIEDDPNKVWAEWAKSKGFIDFKDDEFKSEEGEEFIINKFNESISSKVSEQVNEYKESLPPVIKDILNKYEDGIPLMSLIESETRLQEFSSVKPEEIESNVELQKDIVATYLSSKEMIEEEIKEKLTKYEDAGILKDEAKSNIKLLVKEELAYKQNLIQANKLEQDNRKKQVEENTKKFEDDIMKSSELFKDLPWTEKEKKIVLQTIMKPVGKSSNGSPINELNKMQMEDPMFLPKLAYMAKVLKWDLSPIKTQAKTAAVKQLKKSVTTYKDDGSEQSPSALANFKAAQKAIKEMKKKQIF